MTLPATHTLAPKHAQRPTRFAFVGSYWGPEEARAKAPFAGRSGAVFWSMLADAGISRHDCLITNVINQLVGSDEDLCGPRRGAIAGYPALSKAGFVRAEFIPELNRLGQELLLSNPNIIVAMGGLALWALCKETAISRKRGFVTESTALAVGFKVLPTFNPAHIYRQWQNRATVVLDFLKAKKESEYAEVRRPHREINIPETLEDLRRFDRDYLKHSPIVAVDIETSGDVVTCIGFAPDRSRSLVVPFFKGKKLYWGRDFAEVLGWIRGILERPQEKVFQNGLFDLAFLYRSLGFKVHGATHDTMLLHHSLQPEALKSLEYLGSLYTDEGSWKQMRKKSTTIKKDA
jgi:uracil-DNA glycosylase